MPEPTFYQLLRQRIAEHAEKDYARATKFLEPQPVVPETKSSKHSRYSRWYYKFKEMYGMSYGVYRNRVKKGLLPHVDRRRKHPQEPAPVQEPAPCVTPA